MTRLAAAAATLALLSIAPATAAPTSPADACASGTNVALEKTGFVICQAEVAGGRVVISGITPKPSQTVEIIGESTRRSDVKGHFTFRLAALPEACSVRITDGAAINRLAIGNCGPTGAEGKAGPRGVAGPQGPTGPQGPAGQRGSTGEAGPAGQRGATGADGARGPEGPQGPSGIVAYGFGTAGGYVPDASGILNFNVRSYAEGVVTASTTQITVPAGTYAVSVAYTSRAADYSSVAAFNANTNRPVSGSGVLLPAASLANNLSGGTTIIAQFNTETPLELRYTGPASTVVPTANLSVMRLGDFPASN